MGSFLGFSKGDEKAPLIGRVAEHNRKYNEACLRRWNACPFWRKVLFVLGGLCGNHWISIDERIAALYRRSIGAWCCGVFRPLSDW
jgi:hypothetical protein